MNLVTLLKILQVPLNALRMKLNLLREGGLGNSPKDGDLLFSQPQPHALLVRHNTLHTPSCFAPLSPLVLSPLPGMLFPLTFLCSANSY